MTQDPFGAFIQDQLFIKPKSSGMLDHLIFAAKDVFAVSGHRNSAGNPDWEKTHRPAVRNAQVIDRLLRSGATLRGMTVTDELMYSLRGDNIHYPPTINPRLPDAFSGGSSSGSAVAVAGGLADFAIGTDTGGSVRIPSSYCGLFGMRPSHGSVSLDGVIPLAPSFDTVGWMAGSSGLLQEIGQCLLPEQEIGTFRHFYLLREAWDLVASSTVGTVLNEAVFRYFPSGLEVCTLPYSSPELLSETFRILQGREAWQSHGAWIEKNHPRFGSDIAGRFEAASQMKQDDVWRHAAEVKRHFAEAMSRLLGQDGLIVLPTTFGPAPARTDSAAAGGRVRAQTMKLTCIAGVAGLPQITIPFADQGRPVGLSFISGAGTDRQLLAFVHDLPANDEKNSRA
ncbi:amidase [Sporolactobacillus vineae]|uniref:amidase n=1 Tax=Sporolactobacillus vineae TaxID=444463 RepID=UPI0002F82BD0|nr:amidase [Sporolactobacillus vineae]